MRRWNVLREGNDVLCPNYHRSLVRKYTRPTSSLRDMIQVCKHVAVARLLLSRYHEMI